ncbi:Ribokinase-like protein [Phycomyces nitens]|nr:Ribokinase-like protein [Phycomyces nitens]
MTANPIYASIGSLIIDDIIYEDGSKESNVLGGAGVFAIYGMRCWHAPPDSKKIAYTVQRGHDHPTNVDDQLNRLDISLVSYTHKDKCTTRGLNTFGANDHRDFEYIHPIIRSTPNDFPLEWIKSIRILHIIASTERALEITDEWRKREEGLEGVPTQFLWEPLPWACLPKDLAGIKNAAQRVTILTPNHEEAAGMLGLDIDEMLKKKDIKGVVEDIAHQLYEAIRDSGKPSELVLVVRASKYGTVSLSDRHPLSWVPAYWDYRKPTDISRVRDVTGAGNGFCGGYAVGWVDTNGDIDKASLYGSVSASYMVEQVGVPLHRIVDGKEQWNEGPNPYERLALLEKRM